MGYIIAFKMKLTWFKNFLGLGIVLCLATLPGQAQLGSLGQKLKKEVKKAAKEVTEEVKKSWEEELEQKQTPTREEKKAIEQKAAESPVQSYDKSQKPNMPQPEEQDYLSIMKNVQIAEQTDDSFYAEAKQRDNGVFNENLDLRARFESFAYYLLKLKKAVESRDIEYMAWPEDNKVMMYYFSIFGNPKNEGKGGFSWRGWSSEYQRVTSAVEKIMLSPFKGKWNGSTVSLKDLLLKIDNHLNKIESQNQKKYYLLTSVVKLSEGLSDDRLSDNDPQIQTLVASLKKVHASMGQEYKSIYPAPMTRQEINEMVQKRKTKQQEEIYEEYQERQNRVYDMPRVGRMNTPQMIAIFEKIMRKQFSNEKIVKTIIKSDEWTIQDQGSDRYRVVFGYVIVKKPDGRYQAIPCSMAGKWSPGAGKYEAYRYHSLGTPFYVNYR